MFFIFKLFTEYFKNELFSQFIKIKIMKPNLIDSNVYQKLNEQIQDTIIESGHSPEFNYFNIFGIFFIVLIPTILYYRYVTQKHKKKIIFKYIYNLNKYFE